MQLNSISPGNNECDNLSPVIMTPANIESKHQICPECQKTIFECTCCLIHRTCHNIKRSAESLTPLIPSKEGWKEVARGLCTVYTARLIQADLPQLKVNSQWIHWIVVLPIPPPLPLPDPENQRGRNATHSTYRPRSMDQISIKTPNPKCRLYWCLIEFIDWSSGDTVSHVGFFNPSCEQEPVTFSLVHLPPSPPSLCE